jgi:3-isopropylmalate dehydratase small subunit
VLKVVPATDRVWKQCLDTGIVDIFKRAGALIGNAGCAGCAAGQIGQTGEGEVTVSSGNRNFAGKQGLGEVYLASPATVAASAIAGYITTADALPDEPMLFTSGTAPAGASPTDAAPPTLPASGGTAAQDRPQPPMAVTGRAWVIPKDNIDTDMIFHNRYLSITDMAEMGQYTFDNLEGYGDFAKRARPGDIVITGKNFGAGSSRAQAVDCFRSLGIPVIVAESFGSIYERNAINSAMPILVSKDAVSKINDGDEVRVDFGAGTIEDLTTGEMITGQPFAGIQKEIYLRGGLLK